MYNQRAHYRSEIFDNKFSYFLVLEVLGKENVKHDNVENNRYEFAQRLFQERVKNQPNEARRLERFHHHIIENMNRIKNKQHALNHDNGILDKLRNALNFPFSRK